MSEWRDQLQCSVDFLIGELEPRARPDEFTPPYEEVVMRVLLRVEARGFRRGIEAAAAALDDDLWQFFETPEACEEVVAAIRKLEPGNE